MFREYVSRHWVRVLVSLVILGFFLVHVAKWHEWRIIHRLDNIAYDLRLLVTMPEDVDERIVIVDIDEKSLTEQGRWPWPRDTMARLVDQLFERYAVKLAAFDVVFAEPEETSASALVVALRERGVDIPEAHLAGMRRFFDRDQMLADSIGGRNVVLGIFFSGAEQSGRALEIGELPPALFRSGQFTGRNIPFWRAEGYSANLPSIQRRALAVGHLNSVPDSDGLVRRVPMLFEFDGGYYEALSLAVVRALVEAQRVIPGYPVGSRVGRSYSDLEWLQVGDYRVPVDANVSALIPFRGPQGSFPYVSATDVINGTAPPDLLAGRIALIGATAKGLLDLRATPVQANYPGVEIHANLITGILDGNIKENPAYTLGAEFLLVLVSGLLMALLLPVLSPVWAAALTVGLLGGMIAFNLAVWELGDFVFPMAAGLLTVLALFLFNMWYAYFFEARGKRQLAGLFGEYVPPELVEEMNQDPTSFTLESENRELSVLFSDVRDFTTISEGLGPSELSDLMNEYLSAMTRIIYDHRGTIDKYMGDAIMAFWGAPVHERDHARQALFGAMQMVAALDELNPRLRTRGWPDLRIGVGINTGEMYVGNMGSRYRRAYTVMGDAVNLASRLEGLSKVYGVSIIVSDTTRAAVPEYAFRELDRVRVKGKDKPVTIYEPLGPREAVASEERDEIKLYREALKHYRAQNWDMAELQFVNLHRRSPQRRLYKEYAKRIKYYRRNPPEQDWDGVFTHLEK
ncbi:MAG: adenylate/guanylate cyclase domain-containing protein [Gammaproteobacteria bacterium]|nr:adenylate/guanylate cyclase domain-containing protein [Gammaproteobacteria bacterium]